MADEEGRLSEAPPTLTNLAGGAFSHAEPGFAALLWDEAAGTTPAAYWPRNFLLDPRVYRRVPEYFARGVPASRSGWNAHHRRYLEAEVRYRTPAGLPGAEAVLDEHEVPAPFRSLPEDDPFAGAAGRMRLVRIEDIRRIAEANLLDPTDLARDLGSMPPSGSRSGGDELWLLGLLDTFARQSPSRPVFAGFVADVHDVLSSSLAPTERIEALRDRFGLAYLDPALRGGPIEAAVFTYSVVHVPRAPVRQGTPALRTPTVLDGDEYEAFFPGVLPGPWGNVMSLRDDGLPPIREMLHPGFRYRSEHFSFSATVRSSPAEEIGVSRARHIRWLRRIGGDPDLADDTDPDLRGLGAP